MDDCGCSPPSNVSGDEIIIDHVSPCVNEDFSCSADSPVIKRTTRSVSAERSSSDEPTG